MVLKRTAASRENTCRRVPTDPHSETTERTKAAAAVAEIAADRAQGILCEHPSLSDQRRPGACVAADAGLSFYLTQRGRLHGNSLSPSVSRVYNGALCRHGLIESCGGIKAQTVWREANELAHKVHAILVDFGSTRKEILLNLFGDTREVGTVVSPSWFYENIGSVIDSQLLLSELNKGTHVPSPASVSQTIERARQLGLPVSQGGPATLSQGGGQWGDHRW
jgi:hypothetical protein